MARGRYYPLSDKEVKALGDVVCGLCGLAIKQLLLGIVVGLTVKNTISRKEFEGLLETARVYSLEKEKK